VTRAVLVKTPHPGGVFNAVSCASVGNCAAVGAENDNTAIFAIEKGGRWAAAQEVTTNSGGGTISGILWGVSDTSTGRAVAVGNANSKIEQPIYVNL
jgi:hypothetical protein